MADLGTVVSQETNIPAAWVQDVNNRVYREELTPGLYGAVGDNTDETSELQAALNAAQSSGAILYIPAGKTYLSGPLTITTGMTLKVDGTLKMKDSTGTFLTVTAPSGFKLKGSGVIDLNETQYVGIRIANSTAPEISGSLTIRNMLGGAASTGNSGALEFDTCTRPKTRGLHIADILHGTAPNDSQPRAITLDTCTGANIEATCDSVNTAVVVAGCGDTKLKVDVDGGSVVNDNAFYIITSSRTTIQADILNWDGEPIVASNASDTLVLGGSQINCTGNANGFEDVDGFQFIGTVFRGADAAGILKSRVSNTQSYGVKMLDCVVEVSSTEEVISFFNGQVVDFTLMGSLIDVRYNTGKDFGNRFLRLTDTERFLVDNNIFVFEEAVAAPTTDFFIDLVCSEYSSFKGNRLINRTASARFRVNGLGSLVAADGLFKQGNIDAGRDANYGLAVAEPKDFFGTEAPTAGTFNAGDRVWDTTPSAGGTMGWVCTTAGTPGTWKTFGTIAA